MERKFGTDLECFPGCDISVEDSLKMIKEAGFDYVFCGKYEIGQVTEVKEKAVKAGLDVEFLHAPFRGVNNFWLAGLDYLPLKKTIIASIDSAAENGIPAVVMHLDSGWDPPKISDIGLNRFDSLVEYADKKGVKIAFENIRNFGTIAAMVQRYRDVDAVGYCYDCGHEHCYTKTVHFTELFGDKILCTHIHDNFGKDGRDDPDDHLLMFDGNIDYADMMKRLNAVGYEGPLTVEVEKSEPYSKLTNEEFIRNAYERIVKVSKM